MKNKRILVTGGLGFIGSHFAELLHERCQDCLITIVDNLSYCTARATEEFIWDLYQDKKNTLEILYKDINDYNSVHKHDYVINFAAESHVDNSIKNGQPFLDSNVNGLYNLLRQVDGQRFVQIGTDEVYGSLTLTDTPSVETDLLKPSSVYSSTKAAADLIALSFYTTHKKDIIVTRCTNNFGPRQYTEKLIPTVITRALNNKKIPLYGSGTNVREWIYVKEHCEKVYDVLLYGESGNIYNIRPDTINDYNNKHIIETILSILEKDNNLIEHVTDRKGHDLRYALNDDKFQKLNRQIQLDLPNTKNTFAKDLENTIIWYKDHYDWWDTKSID